MTVRLRVRDEALERTRAELAEALRAAIDGDVRFGRHDRMLYATDASIYQVEPIGVVVPRHVEDVVATMRVCRDRGVPVLPRGGGTSLAGQCVNAAVVIDCAPHVNRILAIDPDRRTARVEPGVVLDELNRAAAVHGLVFGPDVATSTHANLGGMIGNNSAGARSVRYGRTVEHLRSLDVLLADGRCLHLAEGAAERDSAVADLTASLAAVVRPLADEIDRRYPRIRRHVDGYNLDLLLAQLRASSPGTYDRVNLAHLVCGSEGTLAFTLGAELDLVPLPAARGLTLLAFDDVDAALLAVAPLLATNPSAVELVDDMIIALARANLEQAATVERLRRRDGTDPGAVLYVEHAEDDGAALDARLGALRRDFGAAVLEQTRDPDASERAWRLRRAGEPLLHGLPGRRKPITFIEDLAVNPADLPAFVADFRRMLDGFGTRAAYYAHASVGCLHLRPLVDIEDDADLELMRRIADAATDLVRGYGGALSGEHGDGRLRSHLLRRYFGDAICDAFAAVKDLFDPDRRMNPGIVVDPPAMTDALRVRPAGTRVRVPAVETVFRYRPEGGFDEAVHRCNGAGVCRKRAGGTMCPSYRATLDERHATRGRGNALRLAITGQLGPDPDRPAWDDRETLGTLDLCLACKACRRECPSNVDVAKLKAEYLAQRRRAVGGLDLADRAMANVRTLLRLGSLVRGPINAVTGSRLGRTIAERAAGIDARRTPPRLHRSLLRGRPAVGGAAGPAVILFADCFTTWLEPWIGAAAYDLLGALGYRVVLADVGCCGRPAIGHGLPGASRRRIESTMHRLDDAVRRHDAVAVVGCEPSCVSAIRDDWTDLRTAVPVATLDALAARTHAVEDFVETRWDEHPVRPEPACDADGAPVLLHGHCHQKALWGLDATAALLRRVVGGRLEVLDSGCCGMAGAFGYERRHHDLSLRIGELSVFPPVRARPDAEVLAPGTSCRAQILDGTGRRARHPIEVVAASITAAASSSR